MSNTLSTPSRLGACTTAEGTCFTVWAPRAKGVELVLDPSGRRLRHPLSPSDDGQFTLTLPRLADGTEYVLSLEGGPDRPDPCSLHQPRGLPGPSAIFTPSSFQWSDQGWKGVRRSELVFYELHVGTFTPEATFDAIIPRLGQLRELRITAIELMPVGQFPGKWNWGYDGVLPYAAQNSYGGPAGLQRLVDAAHGAGLAVFLDVVYNHFGPEHNYLEEFGPYLTDSYKTPWGKAVNFDGRGSDHVRDYVLANVRMWLEEFHLDGLRLDAVHAIYDLSARHILQEIGETAREVAASTGREIRVIAESDLNDPRIILPTERGGHGIDAQWSDDFHHAAHAFLTGERRGYYADYGSAEQLAKVLDTPFLYAGHYSPHRGRRHGAPPTGIPGDQFVVCLQNHDQVGNRAKGDRLSTLVDSPAKLRLAAALLLLSPHVPLLFMGEEYAETRPFPFFCSFGGKELIEAVQEGRKREFADFVSEPAEIPDPHAVETLESAKLMWSWPEGTVHGQMRRLYHDLLALRRTEPAFRDFDHRTARLVDDSDSALLELTRGAANPIRVLFNLSDRAITLPAAKRAQFSTESPVYGGTRDVASPLTHLFPHECVILAHEGA